MNTRNKHGQGGFTLIEILIVIGIIAVLAAIVLVAVNPARQFAKANDAQRSANLNAILNAVGQYIVDQRGATSTLGITVAPKEIANSGGVDLCTLLVKDGGYMAALPVDPKTGIGGPNVTSADCSTTYNTKYTIEVDDSGRLITVSAPDAEATSTISVSR